METLKAIFSKSINQSLGASQTQNNNAASGKRQSAREFSLDMMVNKKISGSMA